VKMRRIRVVFSCLAIATCTLPLLWSQSLKTSPKTPTSPHILLVYSDVDCSFSVDGEAPQEITAGLPTKISIEVGQHILICTAQGDYKDTEEITVNKDDPKQRIINIALAQRIAASAAAKQQEAEKIAAEREQQATQDAKAKLTQDGLGRLTGSWDCHADDSAGTTSGQIDPGYNAGNLSSSVLVISSGSAHIHFTNSAGASPTGTYEIARSERIATDQERYTRGDMYTSKIGHQVCFNHFGACVSSATWELTYNIDGYDTDESGKRIYLKLGEGECTGNCGRDTHISPGKKTGFFRFPEGNPGIYLDNRYCQK
jgi:hypothetical protein